MPRPAGVGGWGERQAQRDTGMGPRRPRFSPAPVAGTGDNQVHLALREGMPRVGGWGPGRVALCLRPQAPGITQAPLRRRQKKKSSCGLLVILTRVRTLEPRPAHDCGRGRGQEPRGPGTAASSSGPEIAKLRPRTSPRSSCTLGRGLGGGGGGGRKLFLRGRKRERLELGSGSGHGAPAHSMPSPGTMRAPLCQAPCGPHLWVQRAAPSVAPDPLHFVFHPTGPRAPSAAPQAGSGQAAAGSSWCAPCPGGSPVPPAIPSPVLELRLELRGEP